MRGTNAYRRRTTRNPSIIARPSAVAKSFSIHQTPQYLEASLPTPPRTATRAAGNLCLAPIGRVSVLTRHRPLDNANASAWSYKAQHIDGYQAKLRRLARRNQLYLQNGASRKAGMTPLTSSLSPREDETHPDEPHHSSETSKLNWLRAGVLGANDGIVSTALLLLSVIAAGSSRGAILTAGAAAIIAGAISMALGEYVSVSTQRDTERALIQKEREELRDYPEEEHAELVGMLASYGIPNTIAEDAAHAIEASDPLSAHLRLELGMDGEELTNPWAAAGSSAVSFILGAVLPMTATLLTTSEHGAVAVTTVTVLSLALTGLVSAKLSETHSGRAAIHLVIGGALGLAASYGIGLLFGQAIG